MTNNRNGSTEVKHQNCSIQDNSLLLLLHLKMFHGSRVINACPGMCNGPMACLAGLRFRCFGILRSGLSFVRACERGPHMSAGGSAGEEEEGSDGRSYKEPCFLNALILNREWGREKSAIKTIQCCGSNTQIPRAFATY